jgi:hypothetical protein
LATLSKPGAVSGTRQIAVRPDFILKEEAMKRFRLLLALSLVAGLAFLMGRALAKDPAKAENPKKTDDPFAAMAKIGAPGPNHKTLNVLAGTWNAKVKFWMDPTKDPVESDGVCVRKWILGGRFLREEYKGKALNSDFTGIGLIGYDNMRKKYTSMWVDSMSTAIWTNLGTYDSGKKTFTFNGEGPDPYTGMTTKSRDVTRVVDDDKVIVEMYKQVPKAKEFKVLEIVYTRKK